MGLRTWNLQAAPSSWPGACYRGIPRMPTATRSSSQPAARAASWEEHGMLTARMACIQPVLSTRFVWVEESSRDCRYVTDGIILEHGCATRIFSIVCDVHDQPPSWAEYNIATYAHYACTMQSLSFSTSYSHTATLLHSRAFLGCAPTRPSEKSKHRHANRWRHHPAQPGRQGTGARPAAYVWRATCGEPAPCASRTCLARYAWCAGEQRSRVAPTSSEPAWYVATCRDNAVDLFLISSCW